MYPHHEESLKIMEKFFREKEGVIALVFGGMNMNGGPRSRMYAALLGAFSMAFLDALMNIFVTGSWYLQIVKGVLFVTVVFLFSLGRRQTMLER